MCRFFVSSRVEEIDAEGNVNVINEDAGYGMQYMAAMSYIATKTNVQKFVSAWMQYNTEMLNNPLLMYKDKLDAAEEVLGGYVGKISVEMSESSSTGTASIDGLKITLGDATVSNQITFVYTGMEETGTTSEVPAWFSNLYPIIINLMSATSDSTQAAADLLQESYPGVSELSTAIAAILSQTNNINKYDEILAAFINDVSADLLAAQTVLADVSADNMTASFMVGSTATESNAFINVVINGDSTDKIEFTIEVADGALTANSVLSDSTPAWFTAVFPVIAEAINTTTVDSVVSVLDRDFAKVAALVSKIGRAVPSSAGTTGE